MTVLCVCTHIVSNLCNTRIVLPIYSNSFFEILGPWFPILVVDPGSISRLLKGRIVNLEFESLGMSKCTTLEVDLSHII